MGSTAILIPSQRSFENARVDSGSDLTAPSKVSWANAVEEEHEATGWDGVSRLKGESEGRGDDGVGKKSKKKKKKKGKGTSTLEEVLAIPGASCKEEKGKSLRTEKYPGIVEESEGGSVVTDNKTGYKNSHVLNSHSHETDKSSSIASVDWPMSNNFPGRNESLSPQVQGKIGNNTKALDEIKVSPPFKGQGHAVDAGNISNGHGVDEFSVAGLDESGDSGWEIAGSSKSRRGQNHKKQVEISIAGYALKGESLEAAETHRGEVSSSTDVTSGNWDSSWQITGSQLMAEGAPSAWDSSCAESSIASDGTNLESGWEVAGSRRNKKEDDSQNRYLGSSNSSQRSKGRGQPFSTKPNEQNPKGLNKQRSVEGEKVTRSRSAGNNAPEKAGRLNLKNVGRFEVTSNFFSPPVQSAWSKPLNKSVHSASSTSSVASSQTYGGPRGSGSGEFRPPGKQSSSDLGCSEPLAEGHDGQRSPTVSIDAWKGFPAFGGSICVDDYPRSLHSDSQCSDDDFDSDTLSLASADSAESHKSHNTHKRNKWFRIFFQDLDDLTEEQLQEHDRQWHCPACQGGVGAIDWYRGLQPLLAHSRTVRSKRVKLHKLFAEVLEEEIRIRGAAPGTHGSGRYGKWRGLGDDVENKDVLILWPPMVVIRNTQLEQDEEDKWIGMGNKELLDLFKKHNPVKARHAYGPQGHRGISILMFPESPTGYYDAQRLDKHFKEARRGRENWNSAGKVLFQPGGNRILYGYLATGEDLDLFNKHSKGKQNLKWEKRSLHDTVLIPMRKMDEENNKLTHLHGKVQREMEVRNTVLSHIMARLRLREDALKDTRRMAKETHLEQEKEMEDMERIYKMKIDMLKLEISEKEAGLQKFHEDYEQEHLDQCEQLEQRALETPKDKQMTDELQQQKNLVEEEIAKHSRAVERCIKRQEEWEAKKVEMLKEHHQKLMEFKSRQWADLLEFEKGMEQERLEMMESFRFTASNDFDT